MGITGRLPATRSARRGKTRTLECMKNKGEMMRIEVLWTCAIAGLLTVLLSGCAPSTAAGVREMGPERSYVFVAPENYQPVYRKILEQARKCYQTGMITAQMVVQGDLYHDTKSGTVTVALHGGLGVDTYQVIDVSAIDERQTRVIGHYSLGPVEKYGQALREWVLEDSKECGPKEK